jgi:NADH-quinone oxidoreductase subunit A
MEADQVQVAELWPLIGYALAVFAVVMAMLAIPRLLARGGRRADGDEPFESGVVPAGDVHVDFAIPFYPVALFFVIFDLEAIYILAWAVAFRETGWTGYIEMAVFILLLLAGLVYLWRAGALDWRTRRQRLQDRVFAGRADFSPPRPDTEPARWSDSGPNAAPGGYRTPPEREPLGR